MIDDAFQFDKNSSSDPVIGLGTSWSDADGSETISFLDSWSPEPAQTLPVVSARFGRRKPKVSSYFFSASGSDDSKSKSKSVGLFDPYGAKPDDGRSGSAADTVSDVDQAKSKPKGEDQLKSEPESLRQPM